MPALQLTTSSTKTLGTRAACAYQSPAVPEKVSPGACVWELQLMPDRNTSACVSTAARALAEPCSFAAVPCSPPEWLCQPLLQQQGGTHSAGTQIGKLRLWMCLLRAEHPKETSEAIKTSSYVCKEVKRVQPPAFRIECLPILHSLAQRSRPRHQAWPPHNGEYGVRSSGGHHSPPSELHLKSKTCTVFRKKTKAQFVSPKHH